MHLLIVEDERALCDSVDGGVGDVVPVAGGAWVTVGEVCGGVASVAGVSGDVRGSCH